MTTARSNLTDHGVGVATRGKSHALGGLGEGGRQADESQQRGIGATSSLFGEFGPSAQTYKTTRPRVNAGDTRYKMSRRRRNNCLAVVKNILGNNDQQHIGVPRDWRMNDMAGKRGVGAKQNVFPTPEMCMRRCHFLAPSITKC